MGSFLRKALASAAIASLLLAAPGALPYQALAAEIGESGPVRLAPRVVAPSLAVPSLGAGTVAPVSPLPALRASLGSAAAPEAVSAPVSAAAASPLAAAPAAAAPSALAPAGAPSPKAAAGAPGEKSPAAGLMGGAAGARRALDSGDVGKASEELSSLFEGAKRERPSSTLPAGEHEYEDIVAGVRAGQYRFARVRAESGRLNYLLGVSEAQLGALRAEARRLKVGLVLYGSRVSGPRSRQRTLDPLLERSLSLVAEKRSASATYPAAENVRIEKTKIKELGKDDPRTSDITVMLVDSRRSPEQLEETARRLEGRLQDLGVSFPIRVFAGFEGTRFRTLADFQAWGSAYLRKSLDGAPEVSDARLKRAHGELYTTINIARWPFVRADVANGLLGGALLSASFAMTMGWHPVVAAAGFGLGLGGRHLARLRAWIAGERDTFASNALAMAVDTAIGVAVMALFVNPLGGYGLTLARIAGASALHTLAKGSVRLYLDKTFSQGALQAQKWGAALTLAVSFVLGLITGWIYQGLPWAAPLQGAVALAGCLMVFRNPLRRALASVAARLSGRRS